jgi:hypothetical protein
LDRNDVAQLIAEQMAISRIDMAKLISEQVALALAAYERRDIQSPPERHSYERRDTVISSTEPQAIRETHFRDGPMRSIDAQELSNGMDPTFDAWKLQLEDRFEDDHNWYNTERRKLAYMLRRTKGNAQVHMIAGMKNKELPGFFHTAQDALNSLEHALTNPQATKEAQKLFRKLIMSNTESFAQFRTQFLLLAQESHLRPEDYRDELWDKITPTLQTALVAIEADLITYEQLSDRLLSTDSNLRWLTRNAPKAPVANTPTARNRNRAGQFVPTRSDRVDTLALDRSYDRSHSSVLPTAVRSGASATPIRRSNTPALNPNHAGDTCHNCGKVGHRSPDCSLLRAPRTELKELQEPLSSDSESENEHLVKVSGKDEL